MSAVGTRLHMSGITKAFGSVKVLDQVSFHVMPGEIVALLGANGAGKSTLMKILTANYTADEGTISVNDNYVDFTGPADASGAGISFLPQEISIFPELSVAENIGLKTGQSGMVDWTQQANLAAEILQRLGFEHIDPATLVGNLTVAEQRIVEIARALNGQTDILVMDEPTASLSEQESRQIFTLLRRLSKQGTSVVYISHYLKEVFELSDRIVVLRDGVNAGEFTPDTTDVHEVVDAMLGGASGNLFDVIQPIMEHEPVFFSCERLCLPPLIHNISFELRRSEILGIYGLIGSGVEVLGRLLFGAEGYAAKGHMTLGGKPFRPARPANGKAAGIGFVTAERKTDGILAEMSVRENLVAAFQKDFGHGPFTSPKNEKAHSLEWIEKLGIKTSDTEQAIRFLSGGNQQKVCVARWLNPRIRMLILEEPTRGVDVGARREIYNQIVEFARSGIAVLILSSDVEEVAGLSDRSLVIDKGRIIGEFDRDTPPTDLMAANAHVTSH